MKVNRIETIRVGEFPNIIWVQVGTDSGLVGLGETFYAVESVEAHIHEVIAPYLLGQSPLSIDQHNRHMLYNYLGFKSVGTEMRAASAIDIALWDIFGKVTTQPIYQLLGGASRERVRVYNTCAGSEYVRKKPEQGTSNFGLKVDGGGYRPYEDLSGFMNHADELAISLVEEGYTGMKIWPFDAYAEDSGGMHISNQDLKKALEPFEKIRKAVGDKIDIHVEFHSLWNLPMAKKLAKAIEPFNPYWYEDPIKMDNLDALSEYAHSTPVWVTASETLATRWAFRELFDRQAASVCMFDIGWTGGITEAKKIASMAEAYHIPIAPHDCTGPVLLTAAVHLSQHCTNTLVQEVVRAFYHGWYGELVTELPALRDGFIRAPDGPGLGTELHPTVFSRGDVTVRSSKI